MLIGVLVVHIGAKLTQTRRALRTPLQQTGEPVPAKGELYPPRAAVDRGRRGRRRDDHDGRPDVPAR